MDLNRRSVLAGLYAAGITGGLALGSGAFTTVEGERAVEVQVATDGEDSGVVSIFGRFVDGGDSGVSEFVIDEETFDDATADAEGVNVQAGTTFTDVLRLRIEGGSGALYDVRFEDVGDGNGDDDDELADEELFNEETGVGLQFTVNDNSDGAFDEPDNESYPLEINGLDLDEQVILDLEVIAPADLTEELSGTLGIRIESQSG